MNHNGTQHELSLPHSPSTPLTSSATASTQIMGERKSWIGAVKDEWQMFSDCADDYDIGLPIGFGASSTVYQATFRPRGRPPTEVALKVLDLDKLSPKALKLLTQETQLMSFSKHPNVLRVRGSWITGHKLYIALRLMRKGSVTDIIKYRFPDGMEEEVIRCILKQALRGLNYLHTNGCIHRDIKSANLLVDDDGTVLLADLGVAAFLDDDSFSESSVPGPIGVKITNASSRNGAAVARPPALSRSRGKRRSFVGTPCWMAPEVISQKHYDAKADIWSLGMTALELARGRVPHSREPPFKALMKILQEDPPTLDRENGTHKYSKAFKEFIASCLEKDPSKRPTAQELLELPWLKGAKKASYLVDTLLTGLPPLAHRQERRVIPSVNTFHHVESWNFTTVTGDSSRITESHGSIPRHELLGTGDINPIREEHGCHTYESAWTDGMRSDDDVRESPTGGMGAELPTESCGSPLAPIPIPHSPVPDAKLLQLPGLGLSSKPGSSSEPGSSPQSPMTGSSPRSFKFTEHTSGSSRGSSPVPDTPKSASFWKRLAKGGGHSRRRKELK